jgi:hypothetical protein
VRDPVVHVQNYPISLKFKRRRPKGLPPDTYVVLL